MAFQGLNAGFTSQAPGCYAYLEGASQHQFPSSGQPTGCPQVTQKRPLVRYRRLIFTLGLALVLIGGAELFTGNNLIVMAWASGRMSTRTMLRNWTIIWFGNLFGSLGPLFSSFFPSSRYE